MKLPTLLVVEDDLDTAEALQECLEYEGHRVHMARSAGEACTWLSQNPNPCVVVLDWRLPDGTGQRVLEALQGRDVPVVVTSADRLRASPAGGRTALLRKPFEMEALLSFVRSAGC